MTLLGESGRPAGPGRKKLSGKVLFEEKSDNGRAIVEKCRVEGVERKAVYVFE